MTPAPSPLRFDAALRRMMVVLAFAATWMIPSLSTGQTSPRPAATAASAAQPASALRAPAKAATEQGIRWRDLKPTQQAWLKPLELDWPGIDTPQKQKWLQVAAGFPKMSPAEQSRVQARMADWAKLTPQERGRARMNFQEATQLSAPDRQARWDAYQALPPEEKRQLAARAAPRPAASAADATRRPGGGDPHPERADKAAREAAQTKSNIVPNPALASRPKAVSPVVVQASPGATTTTIAKRPAPPSHQQAGLPKIAATPEFVDQATLLPQRGPQGAAAHSETPSSGVDRRRP